MIATNNIFITAEEVAEVLGSSKSFAYKTIQRLNGELAAKGYLTFQGKVSAKYFEEKVYGFKQMEGGDADARISG